MAEDQAVHTAGPVGVFVAKLRETSDGRRSLLGALSRFVVTGLCSVGSDVGMLALLHSALGAPLFLATIVAFACGLAVNYSLNRNWTFQSGADHRRTATRYVVMVAFNLTTTELIVLGLSHLGVYYLLSKLIAVAFNAGINFLAARYWVFAE